MLPRMHATYHRPQAPSFVAMWAAVIIGIIKAGLLGSLVTSLVGPGIGYALATTLPRKAVAPMEVLSFVGAGAVIAITIVR